MADVRQIDDFITVLRRARGAAANGMTGCQSGRPEAKWCYRCAMFNRGAGDGTRFTRYTGPEADWSFGKTREEVLGLFDASIKDMERERREANRRHAQGKNSDGTLT